MFLVNNDLPQLVESDFLMESPIDLLALSVCEKRLHEKSILAYRPKLEDDKILHSHVILSDIECAKEIRDYYSKKLMLLELVSEYPLTPFKKDLSKFVHSDGLKFKSTMVPLAFRLPEFYEYDTKLDQITSASKQDYSLPQHEYKFLGKLFRNTARYKKYEYWFVDYDSTLHRVAIQKENNLISFWERQLEANESGVMKLLGEKRQSAIGNLVFFDITP
jgi:hypothetical protein